MQNSLKFIKSKNYPQNPVVTILIPTLNEKISIKKFLDWCHQGISKIKYSTEIIIVDSSDDGTDKIALKNYASVVKTKKNGLGQAYIDGMSFARGKYILMGDADCTYDFREIKTFIEKFDLGYEFIMGSRFKGRIQTGAMPFLHRYFGTPITTLIFNIIFRTNFSDIHCGMRGITKDALLKMNLESQSWQYASEMILKSVHMELKSIEVPINFFKDLKGRQSHMIREGFLEPWKAGWQNICAMLIYGSDFFFLKPGFLIFSFSGFFIFLLKDGMIVINDSLTLSIYSMLCFVTLSICGLVMLYTGILCKIIFDYNKKFEQKILSIISINKSTILLLIFLTIGLYNSFPIINYFLENNYQLTGINDKLIFNTVFGLYIGTIGILGYGMILIINAVINTTKFRK